MRVQIRTNLVMVGVFACLAGCGAGGDEQSAEVASGLGTVTSFTLINADTDLPISAYDPIAANTKLDIATLPTRNLNVRANVSGKNGSVQFGYDGNASYHVESVAPFALAGDTSGNYNAWTPSAGSHALTATPYANANAGGAKGAAVTLAFSVVDSAGTDAGAGDGGSSGFVGRIALSSDGNQHDTDDWGAQAVSLALLAKAGLQSKTVHFDYDDHIWDSGPGMAAEEKKSVVGGGTRFGFDTSVFFDDLTELSAAVANLVKEINASSASDPLTFILAGPMEVPYEGLLAANPSKRGFVRCVSHSTWNDTHASTHGGHDYVDLIALGCQKVHIHDQNNSRFGAQPMSNWAWLNGGTADDKWVYGRISAVTPNVGDASDCGMVWYVLTGDQDGNPSKLKTYFGL